MFEVVLLNPEIPSNTGNIGRLVLGCGAGLCVVGEPGFDLSEDAALRRAGLDYWPRVDLRRHPSWEAFRGRARGGLVLASKHGTVPYHHHDFEPGDHLLFGGENRGAPEAVHDDPAVQVVRLPMRPAIRAYNLANAVAVVLFEALRQNEPAWFERPEPLAIEEFSGPK